MLKSLVGYAVGATIALGAVCGAPAQTMGEASIEMDGWTYIPIFSDPSPFGNSNADVVEAIVASLRTDNSSAMITGLWCEPDGAGGWSAMSWETSAPEEIASYVFDYVGGDPNDGSLEDLILTWPIDLDPTLQLSFVGSPVMPIAFGDGVKIGDPYEVAVAADPALLSPLEGVGYAAVSALSGHTITSGTFTTGGAGLPYDNECLSVNQLLSCALRDGFESTKTDISLLRANFEMNLEFEADLNGCKTVSPTCRKKTYTLSKGKWVDTCDDWEQIWGPRPYGTGECHYRFKRDVHGERTRIRVHIDTNCEVTTCNQTKFREGVQEAGSVLFHSPFTPNYECPQDGSEPTGVTCKCSGFFSCQSGSWVPARCPWE